MIQLQTDRLRVEICEPGEAPNRTFRFDRAGFVSEIVLDGSHYFCASEPNNLWHPSSGGRGLCSEFQFDVSAQAEIGDYFPKFGVGLLKKFEDDQYWFYKQYECRPFEIVVETGRDFAAFSTAAMPCMGYAAKHRKEIRIKDNHLELHMKVTNVGDKELRIREYCHNFISIGGMAIGPAYELQLPTVALNSEKDLKDFEGSQNYCRSQNGIRIRNYQNQYATVKFSGEQIQRNSNFSWTMMNTEDRAGVTCNESFVPDEIAVWCVDHMMSPEIFYDFVLKPGEGQEWSRCYTFMAE